MRLNTDRATKGLPLGDRRASFMQSKAYEKDLSRVLVDLTNVDSSTVSSAASGCKGGRPKGTTNSAKTSLDTKELQATSDIAKKMQAVKHSLERGARLPKGTFSNIQGQVLGSHGLDNAEFTVNSHTIRHRLRKKDLEKIKPGPKSPAAQIEPLLLI
jgi:hypothetical protein